MRFERVSIIGAGQMGSGIAQVCAVSGIKTTIIDQSEEPLEKSKSGITKSLEKFVKKERMSENDKNAALDRLVFSNKIESTENSDLVIEAIVENESVKTSLFCEIQKHVSKECTFASNTSSIPITRLAAASDRPDNFIGMHFMNPVPIMKLVEIIPSLTTSKKTLNDITELAETLGKTTVTSQDYPGFIVNRILMPMINEAFFTLMNGVASAKDIDQGMMLGTNQPMGPLQLADFIGLDTCKYILDVMYEGLGDTRYAPCPLLCKYVEAGTLGRKTSKGVYTYE